MKIKTLLTICCFFSFSSALFAQNTYDELITKSRRARTTSTILVSAGPVIAAGGIGTLIYGLVQNDIGDSQAIYDNNGNFIGYEDKKYTTEIIIGAAGAAAGIAMALYSIHFSNKSKDLKREARKVRLKTTTDRISIPGLQNGLANNSARQFKLSLVIPL